MTLDMAIVGAGVAGSSLYRLITLGQYNDELRVDLYSIRENQACGIHPCAWMTHVPDFRMMMNLLRMDADRYILREFSSVDFDGFPTGCDLGMIHKPQLLKDMKGTAPVRFDPVDADAYDLVVDCTGAARALLPPAQDDLITSTLQYRVRRDSPQSDDPLPSIRFIKIGYAWSFPLDHNHFHIGVGSLVEELAPSLRRTGLMHPDDTVVCQCQGKVRVGTPNRMAPIHWRNVWGVGESIGTVSPLVGDGIVPSIQCAALFAEYLAEGTPNRYPERVLSEFSWMAKEREVIDRMIAHDGRIGMRDLLVMRNHAHRFGFQLGAKWIFSWLAGKPGRERGA
ncbi:MAG: hypothetical protein LUO93_03150 [Methanomicrobiales archaeon]|nr:hypothetical protein [Methanomicrobiales archaeon]